LNAEINGITRYSGHCPTGAQQLTLPDDTVWAGGVGRIRSFQVSFTQEYLANHLGELFVDCAGIELRERRHQADIALAYLAQAHEEGLAQGFSGDQLYFELIRQAILNRVLLLYATRALNSKPLSEMLVPAKARRIIEYIDANVAGDLRLVELSSVAGVSQSHFSRIFRRTVGMSPHTFVLHRRLARAVDMMRRRNDTVAEIARRCGFADLAHFSRSFKSHFGCTPSKFR
jgi:AraC family transcriptional regulator